MSAFAQYLFHDVQQRPAVLQSSVYVASFALVAFFAVSFMFPMGNQLWRIAVNAGGAPRSLEAESGQLGGEVTVGTDSAASGGNYIEFGKPVAK